MRHRLANFIYDMGGEGKSYTGMCIILKEK
jgi:hypothetical protein